MNLSNHTVSPIFNQDWGGSNLVPFSDRIVTRIQMSLELAGRVATLPALARACAPGFHQRVQNRAQQPLCSDPQWKSRRGRSRAGRPRTSADLRCDRSGRGNGHCSPLIQSRYRIALGEPYPQPSSLTPPKLETDLNSIGPRRTRYVYIAV